MLQAMGLSAQKGAGPAREALGGPDRLFCNSVLAPSPAQQRHHGALREEALTPDVHHARGGVPLRGPGQLLGPAPGHTCEGLQQYFGHRVP